MKRRQSFSSFDDDNDDDEYGEKDRTIRGLEDLRDEHAPAAQNTEDVFLKLARSNSTNSRAADRLERRRVRSTFFFSSSFLLFLFFSSLYFSLFLLETCFSPPLVTRPLANIAPLPPPQLGTPLPIPQFNARGCDAVSSRTPPRYRRIQFIASPSS